MAYPLFDYQKLFHTLPIRCIVFAADNPTFTIVEENDAHAEMMTMRRTDVIGRPLLDAFPDTSGQYQQLGGDNLIASLRTVIQTKQPHTMEVFRSDIMVADGRPEECYWQATHYPILSEDGKKVVLIVQAINDLTYEHLADSRQKHAEKNLRLITQANIALESKLLIANDRLENQVRERTAQLEAANASLEQSNRELQNFAYIASHDLQEPLRKIQAFGNLLESEYAERLGDGHDYLMRMRSAAARMSSLIEDLLQFSRVATKPREFSTIDLTTIAHEVLSDLEVRVQDTGGVVTIGKLPKIQADPVQMRQLLQNLMSNALKFHMVDKSPVVRISATIQRQKHRNTQARLCIIQVQDNGVGFDEKYLDRIFSVFQRLHSRENYEGTGIGLAVCRKIAERHGGTITAKSAPGQGATFIVALPVRHIK